MPLPVLPTSLSPVASRRVRPPRIAGLLTAGALALAVTTVVLDRVAGYLVLVLLVAALAGAAVLAVRARWAALAPEPEDRPAPRPTRRPFDGAAADEAVAEQLRLLHEAYAEKVNIAVAERREELVLELSDSYADEALALLTR